MAERIKKRDVPARLMCIAAAVVLVSGIVTIGAMNLFSTDCLYTDYSVAFDKISIIKGACVLFITLAIIIFVYNIMRLKHGIMAVLIAAAAVRAAAALFWKIEPESDFLITYELGKLLSEKNVFSWGAVLDAYGTSYNGIWSAHMPFVIYQSMLLRITENAVVLRIANAAFSWGSCFFTAKAAQCFGGERAERAALAFMALNPVIIFFIPVLTNQHVSQFFLMLAVWVYFGNLKNLHIKAMLTGLCLGMGQLMRPDMLPVIIAAGVCAIYSSLRYGNAAKKLTEFAAVLFIFMSVIIASNSFLTSAHVVHRNIWQGNIGYKIMVGLNRSTNGGWSASDSRLEGNTEAINVLIKERLKNPLSLVPMLYGKSVYQCGSYVYTWSFNDNMRIAQNIMRRGGSALMIIVCAVAAWKMACMRKKEMYLLYTVIAVYMIVYAIIEVQARYNFVFIPILVLIASAEHHLSK